CSRQAIFRVCRQRWLTLVDRFHVASLYGTFRDVPALSDIGTVDTLNLWRGQPVYMSRANRPSCKVEKKYAYDSRSEYECFVAKRSCDCGRRIASRVDLWARGQHRHHQGTDFGGAPADRIH